MKVKRQKTVKRTLTFYKNNFDLKPPFNVLIDGTFCKAALKFKINIREQLPKYLDAEVRMQTTRCVLAECEYFGEMLYGPLLVLSQFPVVACGHETPHPPVQCIKRMLKKSTEKWFVATQDILLSKKTRRLPGSPLLFISHNAITLEAPSNSSKAAADGKLKNSLHPAEFELAELTKSRASKTSDGSQQVGATGSAQKVEPPTKKKKKRAKAPNSLSCKKKKTQVVTSAAADGLSSRSRRRRRQNKKKFSENSS